MIDVDPPNREAGIARLGPLRLGPRFIRDSDVVKGSQRTRPYGHIPVGMQMAGVVGIDVLFVAAKEGLDFLYVIFSKEKLVRKVESGSEQADMRHNDDVFLFRLAALLNILLKPRPASAFKIVEIPTVLSGCPRIEVRTEEMAVLIVEGEILKSHARNKSRGLLPVVQRL